MRKHRPAHLLLMALLATAMFFPGCEGREDVAAYAPTETFPDDTILRGLSHQKAMVITAHDDDMCAMAGLMSSLHKQGWKIVSLCIRNQDASRNAAHERACKNLIDSASFFDFTHAQMRKDSAEFTYDAIPKHQFTATFDHQLVQQELIQKVNRFQPSVIFTLDHEIGGYGHPEHVFISQLVLDLAKADSIAPAYIYQSVYTDHMEESIMARHARRMKSWGFPGDGWEKAKQAYQVDGMPEPSVQVNIFEEAEAKMNYLMSYNERERKTMGFFIPAFFEYTAQEYFAIFDREFYRIINFQTQSQAAGVRTN